MLDRCRLINENSVPATNSSKLDAECAFTLMPTIISGERFCEGFLLGYLDNGKMLGLMKGLEELDGT